MERLGDDVARELARFGPQAAIGEVAEAWPAAVGEQIARNAWPARIGRDGTLHVHTTDAVWAFELTHRADEIRSRLGLERIRFAPGPLPERSREEVADAQPDAPQPTSDDLDTAAELTAGIGDEKLRKLVARAAAASLARARSDP